MIAGAWVCLLSPLAAAVTITVAGGRISRRTAGWIATLATFVAFGGALVALHRVVGRGPVRPRAGLDRLHLARVGRLPRPGADPARHPLEHDDAHRLGRRRAHRLVLDGLPRRRRRGAALLRVHLALRLRDAPARAGGELPPPARRLGARRPRVAISSSASGTTSRKPSPRPRRRS